MPVPVMNIWIMSMTMCHRLMRVRMAVRLSTVPLKIMLMLMVGIVGMFMVMLHRFMFVEMFVPLGQMQPYTASH